MNLSGNTVLITGGASGIGLAFAKAMLQKDNRVIICGRSTDKLQQAKTLLPKLHCIQCDISLAADLQKMVDELQQGFPTLNLVFHNAALYHEFDFIHDDATLDIIENEINTNLIAPLKLSRLLLPQLLKQPQAAFINISSGVAYSPMKSSIVYSATKAGLHSFSKSLRYQLKDTNIKVFEVLPPLVETPVTAHKPDKKMSADVLVCKALRAIEKDKQEIPIGISIVVKFACRFFPFIIEKELAKL